MSGWWRSTATESTEKALLHITASNSYTDPSSATTVPVNTETPIVISSKSADIELIIRIKDFIGSKEHKSSPSSSPYFDKRLDTNISIQISLKPKEDFNGDELIFGNDFGYPVRDFLPYGVSTGLKLFKWYVDPSVDGDLFIDEPYLYGRALSSFNVINSIAYNGGDELEEGNEKIHSYFDEDLTTEELIENDFEIPKAPTERQKFFQVGDNQKSFRFENGKTYNFDFFSGLVSLQNSEFHINLPGGYSLNLSNYLNDKFNRVRYVLKRDDGNKLGVEFGEPLLIINFELADINDKLDDQLEVEGVLEQQTSDDLEVE